MNFLMCALVALSLALTTTGAFTQAPDTILLNGKIVTADERNTIHQALAPWWAGTWFMRMDRSRNTNSGAERR